MGYQIITLRHHPEWKDRMAVWFHEKWGAPLEAYHDSMDQSLAGVVCHQWYVAQEDGRILGGLGVIDNDFHLRKDLTPNVCAVYTEPDCRGQGIAGALLHHVCRDMADLGVQTLYLVTEHEAFYERYGWEYLCMVQEEGGEHMTRMYVHNA